MSAVAVAFGILSLHSLGALAVRAWPILLFVVAIAVVTELSAEAGLTPIRFAALMIGPGAVAILVPSVLVFLLYRRSLSGRYELPPSNRPDDGVPLWTWAIVVVAILPFGLLPWQLVLFACGLFLVAPVTVVLAVCALYLSS